MGKATPGTVSRPSEVPVVLYNTADLEQIALCVFEWR